VNQWLTPNAGSGQTVARLLVVPLEYLPHISGALEQLLDLWAWEEDGDQSPQEAVDALTAVLEVYYRGVEIGVSDMINLLQERAIWWRTMQVVAGNALAIDLTNDGINFFPYMAQSSPAINDKMRWTSYLDAGFYRLSAVGKMGGANGQMHVSVGGVEQFIMDWYHSAAQYGVFQHGYFAISAGAVTQIDFLMSSKHASSTGYSGTVGAIWIEKL